MDAHGEYNIQTIFDNFKKIVSIEHKPNGVDIQLNEDIIISHLAEQAINMFTKNIYYTFNADTASILFEVFIYL